MNKATIIRNPSLSSTAARKALDHLTTPIYGNVFDTIDSLGAIYDGLEAVRTSQDPTKTREHNALDYKQKFDAAYQRARTIATERMEKLGTYREKIIGDARAKAGLDTLPQPLQAQAIWNALRSMDQKERDAAVLKALESGDRVVMSAIANAPTPMLTGDFTVPVQTSIELFIDQQSPELQPELKHIELAMTFLENAADAFSKSAQKLRDLPAEDRGLAGSAKAQHADAAYKAAMGG